MLGGGEHAYNRKEINSLLQQTQQWSPPLSVAFIVKRRWWFIPEQHSFVN
jgi:hypothetical protein